MLFDKMRQIFNEVQHNKRNHRHFMLRLKKLYKKTDEKLFAETFISCLLIPLSYGEKHQTVENTLYFAATFAISVRSFNNEEDEEEEESYPFLKELFDFLLSNHDTEDSALRFRICYFLNMLLNSMGENAFLADTLCDRITTNMMERLLDKVPKVRAQAIFALHRLQDPSDEHCPVIKAFIFHLCKDPHAEVRRAILVTMGKNKQTLAVVLRRTRDINEGVRKLAYQWLTKITVRSLTIEQRERLLSEGLRDRSASVSKFVETKFLPTWLDHYEGDFIKLLRALDAENALDTSILMLQVLFKAAVLRTIVNQVPVDPNTKLIPLVKLSGESSIYWRCTVKHLQSEGWEDEVDRILPDLSKFCEYIRKFIKFMQEGTREPWELTTLKFILIQLFEIAKTYDLSDEFGREKLKELILDILKSDNDSEALIDCIVQQLVAVVPDTETRLKLLVDVINDIRMPLTTDSVPISEAEQNARDMKRARLRVDLLQAEEEQYNAVKDKDFQKADELKKKIHELKEVITELSAEPVVQDIEEENVIETDKVMLAKCLQIMYSMMQSVTTLHPLLKSLFEDIVLPSLDHPVLRVTILALKATTVCCLMEENLAKKYLPVFFLQFSLENDDVWLAALKGIFDLLLLYGLERLGMPTDEATTDRNSQIRRSKKHKTVRLFSKSDQNEPLPNSPRPALDDSNKNIINILTGLLDNVNQGLRTIAVEGLCKLLLHQKISSSPLLARLIILWHNPVADDDAYLRQCLSHFFNHFAILVPDSLEMMEHCFLPTLKILANAPDISPLQQINPAKVAQLILHLTKQPDAQNLPLAYCPHNSLAFAIIAEALNTYSDIKPGILIRSLKFLELRLEDDATRKRLQEAVEKLLSKVDRSDKRSFNSILRLKNSLYEITGEVVEDEAMVEDDFDAPDI